MSHGGIDDAPDLAGLGSDQQPYPWIGRGDPARSYVHVALAAPERAAVDAFHAAALAAGGRDNGAPGLRPHPHPKHHGPFVLDPDGCNLKPCTTAHDGGGHRQS